MSNVAKDQNREKWSEAYFSLSKYLDSEECCFQLNLVGFMLTDLKNISFSSPSKQLVIVKFVIFQYSEGTSLHP